jgi:hypothetical protein
MPYIKPQSNRATATATHPNPNGSNYSSSNTAAGAQAVTPGAGASFTSGMTPTPTGAAFKASAGMAYAVDPRTPASGLIGGVDGPPPLSLGPSAEREAAGSSAALAQRLAQDFAVARASLRKASGIRVLLSLLQPQRSVAFDAAHVDQVRAFAVAALLGLAQDESIRQILTKLQVRRERRGFRGNRG